MAVYQNLMSMRCGNMMRHSESRIYSQNGEDGVIAHIFDMLGTTNRVAVEIGVTAGGSGLEANTRLLAALGWTVYWFDGESATNYPKNCKFTQAWLTPDNIVHTFQQARVPQEFDLLSIDVDGNDYHLRQALENYRPRVCVQEYNGCVPANTHWVMPRNDSFRWQLWQRDFGASLASLTQQANDLGYDLVHCEQRGVNAFFVRRDCNTFPVFTAEQAWQPLWWAHK